MTIKGVDISTLPHITDNTPGRMPLMIMAILILLIVICYELISMYWESKTINQLQEYAKIIKKGPPKVIQRTKGNKDIIRPVTRAKREYSNQQQDELSEEDKEALKMFKSL